MIVWQIRGMKQPLSIPRIALQVQSEADAYLFLERLRWTDGVVLPELWRDRTLLLPKPRERHVT